MVGKDKRLGNLHPGEIKLGRHFCIWRCQNKVQGPRYWGNIVEVSLDRFHRLGMMIFYL
jgi:hypothetical protein